ncbi:TIGR02270 family protein [Mesorhizobium sangaii]|uniref:Uncharacterized protein (TIGR02270 family) n=1 Tax=Mesorhizobium sangaii TaxID=505389 RepID=A0A841P5L8_9HYPH|nr:TIGR02270 family protein [Mesorhizobium sangaii]MBB6408623.1 uncharacterized protein (TIGR02270 family) [Mesorhizobium sangaii]
MPRVIEHIIDQHAGDAAFLWLQRDEATDAPHHRRKELDRLDERLEAHIDGLRVAGEWGWRAAEAAFEQYGEPGEAFVAAVLAFENHSERRIARVLNSIASSAELSRAVIAALGWVEPSLLRGTVQALLGDSDPQKRLLGLAACSVHRVDPAARLVEFLDDAAPTRARALRLVGELGRADLLPEIRRALRDPDDSCRFWAAWSAALVGDRRDAPQALCEQAGTDNRLGRKGLQVLLSAMDTESALAWLNNMRGDPSKARLLAAGAGVFGDPSFVPWLLTQMRDSKLARVAGESFSMISGVELETEGLATSAPNAVEHSEDEDIDDETHRDYYLPWPDRSKIIQWWRQNEANFSRGNRYLLGRQLAAGNLEAVFATGAQRQRRAAALEMALATPRAPLANCSLRTISSAANAGWLLSA